MAWKNPQVGKYPLVAFWTKEPEYTLAAHEISIRVTGVFGDLN